jgi:hypothetical protein
VDEKENEIKNQVFLVALLLCCFVAAPAVHRQQIPESCISMRNDLDYDGGVVVSGLRKIDPQPGNWKH